MTRSAPSNETLAKVLEQLSTDRDFREHLLGDPVSALKTHGIDVDPHSVPAVRSLPSMAEVARLHQRFLADPQDKVCIAVFMLVGARH